MRTYVQQTLAFTEDTLTLFPEDSHANHTAQPESGLEKKMTATSGRKCCEQLMRFSRVGSWAKTFSGLLIGQAGWYSTKCRLIWKLRGTKYSRMYCQLRPLAHPTEEIGHGLLPTTLAQAKEETNFDAYDLRMQRLVDKGHKPFTMPLDQMALRGLLPTPRANKVNGCDLNSENLANRNKSNLEETVAMWVVSGMLPTLTAMDSTNATANMKSSQVKEGSMHSVTLTRAMAMGMLPTPATRDYKGARSSEALEAAGRTITNSLPDAFHQTGTSSQLNPQFVLEMMGFPPNWTLLPFQSGETNP